jgi:hypothetical protein
MTPESPQYPPVYFFAVGSAEIVEDHPLAGGPPGSVVTEGEYNAEGKGSVRLTFNRGFNEGGTTTVQGYLSPAEARNLAAHLTAAATIAESSLPQTPAPEPW